MESTDACINLMSRELMMRGVRREEGSQSSGVRMEELAGRGELGELLMLSKRS